MNNASICRSVREEASALGYDFAMAEEKFSAAAADCRFPFALLAPPEIHDVQGRRHGRIEYDIELRLLDAAADLDAAGRTALRQKMESDALALFVALSQHDRIIAVENLKTAFSHFTATLRGEIMLTATARVVTCF